jgi:oxygen-independent coproporphyrinogen-3 oxidase
MKQYSFFLESVKEIHPTGFIYHYEESLTTCKEILNSGHLVSASYIGNKRYSNTKSLTQYLKGERVKDEETLTKEDQEFYFLMLGLRLEEGVSIDRFKKLYNEDLLVKYQDKIKELEERRLVQLKDGRLIVTKENLFILDYILQKLLF